MFSLVVALTPTAVSADKVPFSDEAVAKLDEALELASPETKQCVACHLQYTPFIVTDWLRSKMAWSTPATFLEKLYAEKLQKPEIIDKINPNFLNYGYTVGCYECHSLAVQEAAPDRPDMVEHFGFKISTIVTLKSCSQCHPKEAMELSWTMHGFAALNGPLKPWYSKIVKYAKENDRFEILPPVYRNTNRELISWDWYKQYSTKIMNGKFEDPEVKRFGTIYDNMFKDIISPLYPPSGIANTEVLPRLGFKAQIMGYEVATLSEHPLFLNSYVYHACFQCHGTLVVPYKKETQSVENLVTGTKLVFERVEYWGWPNNGAGRVDPDGSIGTCTACHTRHTFSIKQAREPWTCGQCHLGIDHPHIEIYEQSKHGNIWEAYGGEWNWTALPWKVGVHFSAPTCATCHMSTLANKDGKILVEGSHDLRKRLVWDQMHFFSYPKPKWPDHTQNAIILGASQLTGKGLLEKKVAVEGYRIVLEELPKEGEIRFPKVLRIEYYGELAERRNEMKKVCNLCHSRQWVDNYFLTFDQNMIDYNITAQYAYQLLQKAYEQGIHDPTNKLDEYMEIMWYYIWHHDGRRWRNGAAMMSPEYAFWLGIVDTVMDKLGRMISYYEAATELLELKKSIELAPPGATMAPAAISEIEAKISELEQKIKTLEAEFPVMRSAIDNIERIVSEAKQKAEEAATKASSAESKVAELETSVDELSTKLEAIAKPTQLIVAIIALIISVVAIAIALRRK